MIKVMEFDHHIIIITKTREWIETKRGMATDNADPKVLSGLVLCLELS